MNQVLRGRTWSQSALEQRLRPVADDFRRIEVILAAQSVAFRTRAVHAIERKRPWLQYRNVDAALRTRQFGRVQPFLSVYHRYLHQAVSQLHGSQHICRQQLLDACSHQPAVDHHFDGMVFALVELDVFDIQIAKLPVDAGFYVTLLDQLVELFLELTFTPSYDRCQDHHPFFRLQLHHALYDLLCRLPSNLAPTIWAMRHPN